MVELSLQINLIVLASFYLVIQSYLFFGENRVYRFGEYTLTSIMLAHGVVIAIGPIRSIGIAGITAGKWWMIIPMILGILSFSRLIRGYEYFSRWPVAMVIGVGAALTVRGLISAQIISLVKTSLAFIFTPYSPVTWTNGLISLSCMVLTLCVFIFTMEHKGVLKYLAYAGRIVIMLSFGLNGAALAFGTFEGAALSWEKILATIGLLPVR